MIASHGKMGQLDPRLLDYSPNVYLVGWAPRAHQIYFDSAWVAKLPTLPRLHYGIVYNNGEGRWSAELDRFVRTCHLKINYRGKFL